MNSLSQCYFNFSATSNALKMELRDGALILPTRTKYISLGQKNQSRSIWKLSDSALEVHRI